MVLLRKLKWLGHTFRLYSLVNAIGQNGKIRILPNTDKYLNNCIKSLPSQLPLPACLPVLSWLENLHSLLWFYMICPLFLGCGQTTILMQSGTTSNRSNFFIERSREFWLETPPPYNSPHSRLILGLSVWITNHGKDGQLCLDSLLILLLRSSLHFSIRNHLFFSLHLGITPLLAVSLKRPVSN